MLWTFLVSRADSFSDVFELDVATVVEVVDRDGWMEG